MRSRQTHSQRQISLTPRYPAAQSILIKKRFLLLHQSELQASFLDVCPQREAAGSIADVTLSFRASPPALPLQTQPQTLRCQLGSQEEVSFLFSSKPWLAFPKQESPRAAPLCWPALKPQPGPAFPTTGQEQLLLPALGFSLLRILSHCQHLFREASLSYSPAEREGMGSRGTGALSHCTKCFLPSYCVQNVILTIHPCLQAAPRENNDEIGPLGPKGKDKMESKHWTIHSFVHSFLNVPTIYARWFSM